MARPLGALDAHLHRRAVGIRPAGRDRRQTAARIGAITAMAGGALWILTLAVAIGEDPAMGDLPMTLIGLTLSLFVLALAALSAVRAGSHRLLMLASFLLPAVGIALLIGGVVAQVTVGDRPLAGEFAPFTLDGSGAVLLGPATAVAFSVP